MNQQILSQDEVDALLQGITGETRLNESYIRRRLLLAQGQQFNPVAIEKARQDLAAVPAIAAAVAPL